MAEHRLTGGSKEFSYTKEESERIRSTDTESSREFKRAYKDWEERKMREKEQKMELENLKAQERRLERMRRNLVIGLVTLLALLLFLAILRVA